MSDSALGGRLLLSSNSAGDGLHGDIDAIVDQPFVAIESGLSGAAQWCDVLMLHLDDKGCSWRPAGSETRLLLAVVRRFDLPLSDASMIDFGFHVESNPRGYLGVLLNAAEGPLGTRNYRLAFEAAPRDEQSSYVHLSYAYAAGTAARLATQIYLATAGRDKVGFTVVGRNGDGTPIYVSDERGVVERNAMRYFLAIEACLRARSLPVAEQSEQRMRLWFSGTERYPRQLHEMGRSEYLAMKRREIEAQHADAAKPRP